MDKPTAKSRHVPVEEKPHLIAPGIHRIYRFENGYGASVVRFQMPLGVSVGGISYGSYTNSEDEWEVAVIQYKGDKWEISYKTPITDDVIGHVHESELDDLLDRIAALPSAEGGVQ